MTKQIVTIEPFQVPPERVHPSLTEYDPHLARRPFLNAALVLSGTLVWAYYCMQQPSQRKMMHLSSRQRHASQPAHQIYVCSLFQEKPPS